MAVCFDMDVETAKEKMALFEKEIESYNLQNNGAVVQLQMAIGMSAYNTETDKEYMDVFRRADSAMYVDKKKKKAMEG